MMRLISRCAKLRLSFCCGVFVETSRAGPEGFKMCPTLFGNRLVMNIPMAAYSYIAALLSSRDLLYVVIQTILDIAIWNIFNYVHVITMCGQIVKYLAIQHKYHVVCIQENRLVSVNQ